MKVVLRAAVAVFSLGIGSAYAGDGDGASVTTLFTTIQDKQAASARSATSRICEIAWAASKYARMVESVIAGASAKSGYCALKSR